jgi:Uma2 family endonuclease
MAAMFSPASPFRSPKSLPRTEEDTMVATRRVTIEEFEAMPLEGNWELIDGELVEVSPAGNRSVWIASEIFARLREHARATSLGWAFAGGAGFVLFDDRATVRVPDAAYVRRERMPELSDHFASLAPDLAVEFLSPSDRMADALSKIAMYLDAGVRLVWLVEPKERTVPVFHPDSPPKTLGEGESLDGGDILPGLSIPIAEFFA